MLKYILFEDPILYVDIEHIILPKYYTYFYTYHGDELYCEGIVALLDTITWAELRTIKQIFE